MTHSKHAITCLVLIFLASVLVLPPLPALGEISSWWVPREGPTAFQERVEILTGPVDDQRVRALVRSGGPFGAPRFEPSTLKFDFQASLLGLARQRSRQFEEFMAWRPLATKQGLFRWQANAGFGVDLAGGLFLHQQTCVDSDPLFDPTARTKEFRQIDASVEVPLAVAGYRNEHVTFWVGRQWETWGPGLTGSLVLDSHSPTPDGFGATYRRDRWSARYRLGRLDDIAAEGESLARYLAGHRLDLAIKSGLRLGFSETAVVATSGPLPLWLVNPLLPWCLSQQEDRGAGETTNILWAVDADWRVSNSWNVYGQFLLDDVMVDLGDRETYPDQLGVLTGALWSSGPAPRWEAGLEFARLWSWTYVHRNQSTRYQAWNAGLGHPQGPDSEALTVFARRSAPTGPTALLIWGRWHRQGQVRLNTEETPNAASGLPFPTPPVSTWWQFGANAVFTKPQSFRLSLDLGWTEAITQGAPAPKDSGTSPARGWWAQFRVHLPLLRQVWGL